MQVAGCGDGARGPGLEHAHLSEPAPARTRPLAGDPTQRRRLLGPRIDPVPSGPIPLELGTLAGSLQLLGALRGHPVSPLHEPVPLRCLPVEPEGTPSMDHAIGTLKHASRSHEYGIDHRSGVRAHVPGGPHVRSPTSMSGPSSTVTDERLPTRRVAVPETSGRRPQRGTLVEARRWQTLLWGTRERIAAPALPASRLGDPARASRVLGRVEEAVITRARGSDRHPRLGNPQGPSTALLSWHLTVGGLANAPPDRAGDSLLRDRPLLEPGRTKVLTRH